MNMEKQLSGDHMAHGKRILLVSDFHVNVYVWRKEIIDELRRNNNEVALAVPYGEKLEYFKDIGCTLFDVDLDRYSLGIVSNFKLLLRYRHILNEFKPDVVLLYGSKGMLYTGFFCRVKKIKYITNINGLGTFEDLHFPVKNIIFFLYRIVVPGSACVFFQNAYNMKRLQEMKIKGKNNRLIPGSGVNLDIFKLVPFPKEEVVRFLFCARLTREKGIYEYLEAAKEIKDSGIIAEFDIIGMGEQSIIDDVNQYKDYVAYHGFQMDVRPFIEKTQCVVLPSFYGEGISNSLLESASSGRPIITTDMPGCRETVDNEITGFIIKPKNSHLLADAMKKFCAMTWEERLEMGLKGREFVEKKYNRIDVVNAYMEEISKL